MVDPNSIANAVCSSSGKDIFVWAMGLIGVTNVAAWSKTFMGKMPKPVQHVINFVALNWRQIAVDLGVLKS